MIFHIKDGSFEIELEYKLDISDILLRECHPHKDYLSYFADQHKSIFSHLSISIGAKNRLLKISYKDFNNFIWLAVAHQAYRERSSQLKDISKKIEQSISKIYTQDSQEWLEAYLKATDLLIAARVSASRSYEKIKQCEKRDFPIYTQPYMEIINMVEKRINSYKKSRLNKKGTYCTFFYVYFLKMICITL